MNGNEATFNKKPSLPCQLKISLTILVSLDSRRAGEVLVVIEVTPRI
jgi:hypothetical protein